uniref:Cenp-C2 n=1 Tax=Drosophila seriema TaxID=271509 RepID=A0A2R8G5Y4_9MUSC|nr:Cenp-C2 [Drosophila seriema]
MRELEDILNESETYADRLTAFLKLKTAPKPANNGPLLMCDADMSFDFDVDLIKLPPKLPPTAPKDAIAAAHKEQPLREITNQDLQRETEGATVQQQNTVPTSPTPVNGCPTSISSSSGLSLTSPRKSLSRRSWIHVPGSDRLRRVAIQRRSRSCGRRDLLKEFNNLSKLSSNFEPPVSSTPVLENNDTPNPQQPSQEKLRKEQRDEQFSQVSNSQHSMMLTSQRPSSPDGNSKRRTYTIEMGPEPGQLLLSPSRKCSQNVSMSNSPLRQTRSRLAQYREQAELSAARLKILAPNTPVRSLSHTQPNPEYIVPETQSQPMLQNLPNNALVAPFMVVPISSMLPVNTQPATVTAPVDAAVQVNPAPTVASRSIQTSCTPNVVQKLQEIMTDDDSDEERQSSRAPLNLAAPTDNNNRQRSLRSREQRTDNSIQLLDLHRSRSRDPHKRDKCKPRQTVLNKPSQPAINGEQFAYELARMSNYEILDLRKRNSLNRQRPLNGRRQQPTEQEKEQLLLDKHIEWEILRRNLDEPSEQDVLFTAVPMSQDETMPAGSFVQSPAAPPMDFRDSALLEQNSFRLQEERSHVSRHETVRQTITLSSMSPAAPPADFRDTSVLPQQKTRRLRSRHREPPMSDNELLTVCTPPAQFRRSKSRQREKRMEHQVDANVENQQQELQILPPAQFGNETQQVYSFVEDGYNEEILTEERPSTSIFAQESMRLRTSSRLKRQEKKEHQRKENQEKELQAELQQIEENQNTEQQEKELREKQQLENVNKQKQEEKKKRQQRELLDIHEKEQIENEQRKQQENQLREQQKKQLEEDKQQEEEQLREKQQQENLLMGQILEDEPEIEQQREEREQSKLKRKKKDQTLNEKQQLEQQKMHQQETHEQDEPMQRSEQAPPENVFKKPTGPAPRSKANKKGRLERQLSILRITVGDATLPPNKDEANSNGVRRSKRGQVPLCNTWVHSVSDPFQFMRKLIDPPKKSASKKSKKRAAPTADGGSSMINKPPLSSSTPHSVPVPSRNKRTKQQQKQQDQKQHQNDELNDSDAISGISRLSYILEENEPAEPETETALNVVEPTVVPKNRERKKKAPPEYSEPTRETKDKQKEDKQVPAATEVEQIAEEREKDAILIPDLEMASPLSNQSYEPSSETLISWLCGKSEMPPDSTDACEPMSDSMSVSRAANLHFSNIDGIEYAFYHTEDRYSMGYMRFQPLQQRGMKRAKTNTLRFVALHGSFEFDIIRPKSEVTCHNILYTGDIIEIQTGSRYDIKNRLDKVSVIMVYRN